MKTRLVLFLLIWFILYCAALVLESLGLIP